ncbi:MAG: cell division protein ZapE, partial [Anaplasmataceae bacterium]|nr:cell division protein ZapE [Anaplasmataceae bacterium]
RFTIVKKKMRIHFHDFMNYIHSQISKYSSLKIISSLLIKEYDLICLDELDIYDIADAMIILKLMKYLFKSRIKLIITSNSCPDLLYKNGINRDNILPMIELFKKKFCCYFLDIKNDYRLLLSNNEINNFLVGLGDNTDKLYNYFDKLDIENTPCNIFVNGKKLLLKNTKNKVLFIKFDEIFNESYGINEYMAISKKFNLIIIIDIKCLSNDNNLIRRFMIFIDFIYDRKLSLLCSSEVSIDDLSDANYFARTKSRLKELDKKDIYKANEL